MLNGYYLIDKAIALAAVLIALTVHEWGHALAADLLGDPTPRRAGRLTLNPLAHLDLMGTLALVFLRFGWAKPVPVDPRYFKNAFWGEIAVSLAGVFMNLLTAFLVGVGLFVGLRLGSRPMELMLAFAESLMIINCVLVVCNLIPLPPLDGARLWMAFLPSRVSYRIEYYANRYFYVGFIVLVLLGRYIIFQPAFALYRGLFLAARGLVF